MDLLVEKEDLTVQLSEMGLIVRDVKAPLSKMVTTRNDISFKNGKLFYGAVNSEKEITVSASYYADDDYLDLLFQDKLNALLGSQEPFYITRMYSLGDQYSFERPGESTGFDMTNSSRQFSYHYRWRVILSDVISYDFQGKNGKGLLTNVTISFVTSDIPFGISIPEDIDLTGSSFISYLGTADCSQLEWPFYFELTATEDQSNDFELSVNDKTFKYIGDKTIKKDDVFKIKGTSFLLNDLSINDKTNIEYFVLKPSSQNTNKISSDFKGTILLKNKVDFYL